MAKKNGEAPAPDPEGEEDAEAKAARLAEEENRAAEEAAAEAERALKEAEGDEEGDAQLTGDIKWLREQIEAQDKLIKSLSEGQNGLQSQVAKNQEAITKTLQDISASLLVRNQAQTEPEGLQPKPLKKGVPAPVPEDPEAPREQKRRQTDKPKKQTRNWM